ncbi:MAG: AtpZ/AtpI family protein [Anaerolineales bacterium]|nr:AtpZ/AtpI family protein [Anaerolineales bacterium]
MFKNQDGNDHSNQRTTNLVIAGVLGQIGFINVVIIIGAMILGLWLDSHFDTRPVFTFILILVSVPFTIVFMLVIIRKAQQKIKHTAPEKQSEVLEGQNDEFAQ